MRERSRRQSAFLLTVALLGSAACGDSSSTGGAGGSGGNSPIGGAGGAGATGGASAGPTIDVDLATQTAAVSPLLRLGVQANNAAPEIGPVITTEQSIGHVRLDLGWAVMSPATSPANAVARLQSAHVADQVRALQTLGATVTLNLVETPQYISSCPADTAANPAYGWPGYSLCPPADLAVWGSLVGAIVHEVAVVEGLDVEWEVWNEPEGAFTGTVEDFIALYHATALAIRTESPTAAVGGPTLSSAWSGTTPGAASPGFMQTFIEACANTPIPELGLSRTPIDFVVWHEFGLLPTSADRAVQDVKKWLTDAGYPADTKLIVDEWNIAVESNPAPGTDLTFADSEFNAAYAAARLVHARNSGLTEHAFSALADWSFGPPEFHGGQGLTTGTGLRKPVWNAMRLLGFVQGEERALTTHGLPFGAEVIASTSDNAVSILVVHPTAPVILALQQFFGIENGDQQAALAEIATIDEQTAIGLFVDFDVDPATLGLSDAATVLLTQAVERARGWHDADAPYDVTLNINDVPAGFTEVETTIVDATHANSFRAWQAAGGSGNAALNAARDAMSLVPTTSSREDTSSASIALHLEPNSVVLVRLRTAQ
ncbi:MAG: hypothetical protein U0271_41150 [Polyangiaceae bacterium]